MQATIVGLSQELSFLDGETTNSLLLELPNGMLVRTLLDDESAAAVTAAFVQSGAPAAVTATQRSTAATAASSPAPAPRPAPHPALQVETPLARQYSPVALDSEDVDDSDPEDASTFGGDYAGSVAAIGQQLDLAAQSIARAVGDTTDLDKAGLQEAANRLRQAGTELPTPNWVATERAEQPAQQTRRRVQVTQDSMGNPVLRGTGLVNPIALLGGSNIEAGDAGQL